MASHRIRWNRLIMLAVGIMAVLLLCCIGVIVLAPSMRSVLQAQFWKMDQALAARAAAGMFDYDLPPDYAETKVLTIDGRDSAVILAHRERPDDLIFVERVLDGIIQNDSWRTRYEDNLAQEMGERHFQTKPVSAQQITVRGQPTTVRTFEGVDDKGRPVRQVVCGFIGKGSDLLLGIVAGQDTWDQAMLDRFLQSIR